MLGDIVDQLQTSLDCQDNKNIHNTGHPDFDKCNSRQSETEPGVLAEPVSAKFPSFVIDIIKHVARQEDVGVVLFSTQQSGVNCALNILSSESSICQDKILSVNFKADELCEFARSMAEISNENTFINDSSLISPDDINKCVQQLRAKQQTGLIIIDNINNIKLQDKSISREEEQIEINRKLNSLSQELNASIIVLTADENDSIDKHAGKLPYSQDENNAEISKPDADKVYFVCRGSV